MAFYKEFEIIFPLSGFLLNKLMEGHKKRKDNLRPNTFKLVKGNFWNHVYPLKNSKVSVLPVFRLFFRYVFYAS
jgi:hypothetical protein